MAIKEAIRKTMDGQGLSLQESYAVANFIMGGEATDAQIAALLVALRFKGETIDEITGFAKSMREKVNVVPSSAGNLVDTCGTGGDNSGTNNISTVSAFVAAGAGCKVAKHGNRSVSSKCGSADLFKELGMNIEITPEQMGQCIDETSIGFLFAPLLHPAMKYAIGPRREMGIRTIFNILGPLTNPAGAKRQVMGVFSPDLTEPLANVLNQLGSEHVMVVHGSGLDEITLAGETQISELKNGTVRTYNIGPEDLGLAEVTMDDLKGGEAAENAKITMSILKGEKGPKRDVVLANAGAVIYVAGMASSHNDGIRMAEESIDSGKALKVVENLKTLTASMS